MEQEDWPLSSLRDLDEVWGLLDHSPNNKLSVPLPPLYLKTEAESRFRNAGDL